MSRDVFSREQEDEIIRRYLEGEGAMEVARAFGRSRTAVKNLLQRNGVALRERLLQIHIDTIRLHGSLADRLKSLVRENKDTGCWEFIGSPDPQTGYGNTTLWRRRISIHRLAWMAYVGFIPEGYVVCHHCDNRLCGNPEHLFVGTPSDNANDAKRKGRLLSGTKRSLLHRGERAAQAKLTWTKVREIRARLAAGASRFDLAKEFGVHHTNIHHIQLGKTWKEGWHA